MKKDIRTLLAGLAIVFLAWAMGGVMTTFGTPLWSIALPVIGLICTISIMGLTNED